MSEPIKVISFNIEYCASVTKGYWQYLTSSWKWLLPHRMDTVWDVAELINKESADICTFMELDNTSFRTMKNDYLDIWAHTTHLKQGKYFPVRRLFGLVKQGNGVLTKYPIIDTENIKLETHGENRYLSIARLQIDDTPIHVFTTQLALGKISRVKELKHIANVINDTPGPIILTGDLNTHNENELDILRNTRLKRVETPHTFPSWAPSRRLDYIFHSDDFELQNCYVLKELKTSDHLPVVAELKLK
jgi:endonuclease/exonuclease/phosphatase family metal-dependent hydrolase